MKPVLLQRLSNSLVVVVPRLALAQLKWPRGAMLEVAVGANSITYRPIKTVALGNDETADAGTTDTSGDTEAKR